MDHEETIRGLRLRLRIERSVALAVALVLIGWWAYGHFTSSKSLIIVDGKPLVCVSSQQDATEILDKIKSRTGCNPSEIEFRQAVSVARAPRDAHSVSRHKAMRVMLRAISPVVPRWAIIAGGKPVVALPSREAAGDTLELAKLKFGKLAANLAEEPQFKENVTVDIAAVEPAIYRKTPEAAVKLLFAESKPVTADSIYVVQNGDVASAIAYRHGTKLDELWAMNPGLNLNHLQIGDKIRVKVTGVPQPKLTVVVRDLRERVETIPAPIRRVSSARLYTGKSIELSPGRSGQRRVKAAVIYENGRKIGSEIVEEEILREPKPRRIAIGIKPGR